MNDHRRHGNPPIRIVVVHGGPGARGEMEPVARELALHAGVLEPFQSATTIDGQVQELAGCVERYADTPVTLVGYSWGAWLSLITVARHPMLVKKLVLVSSGPFEARHAASITATRTSRLEPSEALEFTALLEALADNNSSIQGEAFARLGHRDPARALQRVGILASKADAFDPIETRPPVPVDAAQVDTFQHVMAEAMELRRGGGLLNLAKHVTCPVVAIHGEHDPHPAAGVRDPLEQVLDDFRFIMLDRCGHVPWNERHAREPFLRILASECVEAKPF